MNNQSKAKCYRKIYADLKNKKEVTNLGFPPQEQRKHYDIFFDIGDLHVDYRLRSDTDLLMVRVSKDIPDWIDEANARNFCKNELSSNKYRWFAENGKLSGSYTLPLSGLSEEKAQKEANSGTGDFIQYLISKKEKMDSFFEKPVPADPEPLEKGNDFSVPHADLSEGPDSPIIPVPEMDPEPLEDSVKVEEEEILPVTGKEASNPPVISSEEEGSREPENKKAFDEPKRKEPKTEKQDIGRNKQDKPASDIHTTQSVADTFYKERSEFEKFCSTQIAEIERRQQLVKKMEDAVDDKIADYQKKNEILMRQKADVLAMKDKNEKDSADIAERIALTQELQNKEQMIAILQENIEAKDKEMKRGSFFSGILPETDTVDKEKHESCIKALQDSEQTVQDLQAEVSRLTAENNKIRRLYDGIQSTAEKERVEQSKLEEQIHQMEQQLSNTKKQISDLETKLGQAQMETVKPVDMEDFENAGFSVKEIVGEKEGLYRLEASDIPDGLTIVIDTLHRFALLQKSLRRGKKYMRTIQEWNTDDLHSSYTLDNNLLIVKKYLYSDETVSDLREIMNRIESLR